VLTGKLLEDIAVSACEMAEKNKKNKSSYSSSSQIRKWHVPSNRRYKLTLITASYSISLQSSDYRYTADLSRLEVIELDYIFSVQNLSRG
jgi:hypothetical protein